MSADQIGGALGILASLVLVGSALAARRDYLRGRVWRMALAWAAIFVMLIGTGLWIDSHR